MSAFSGGMKRRLSLAISVLGAPRILCLGSVCVCVCVVCSVRGVCVCERVRVTQSHLSTINTHHLTP